MIVFSIVVLPAMALIRWYFMRGNVDAIWSKYDRPDRTKNEYHW